MENKKTKTENTDKEIDKIIMIRKDINNHVENMIMDICKKHNIKLSNELDYNISVDYDIENIINNIMEHIKRIKSNQEIEQQIGSLSQKEKDNILNKFRRKENGNTNATNN